jgi:hypothetical protein
MAIMSFVYIQDFAFILIRQCDNSQFSYHGQLRTGARVEQSISIVSSLMQVAILSIFPLPKGQLQSALVDDYAVFGVPSVARCKRYSLSGANLWY